MQHATPVTLLVHSTAEPHPFLAHLWLVVIKVCWMSCVQSGEAMLIFTINNDCSNRVYCKHWQSYSNTSHAYNQPLLFRNEPYHMCITRCYCKHVVRPANTQKVINKPLPQLHCTHRPGLGANATSCTGSWTMPKIFCNLCHFLSVSLYSNICRPLCIDPGSSVPTTNIGEWILQSHICTLI